MTSAPQETVVVQSSHAPRGHSPTVAFGRLSLGIGATLFLLAAVAFLGRTLPAIRNPHTISGEPWTYFSVWGSVAMAAIVTIGAALIGLRLVVTGLGKATSIWAPPGLPSWYVSEARVRHALQYGELSHELQDTSWIRLLRSYSPAIMFAPRWLRDMASRMLGGGVRLATFGVALVVGVVVAKNILGRDSVLQNLAENSLALADSVSALSSSLPVMPGVLLFLCGIGLIGATFWPLRTLVPPDISSHKRSQRVVGTLYPEHLPKRMQEVLDSGPWEAWPRSRLSETGFMIEGGVQDTGQVHGSVIFEGRLGPDDEYQDQHWLAPSVVGATVMLLGFLLFFFGIPAANDLPSLDNPASFLAGSFIPTAIWLLAMWPMISRGSSLLDTGRDLSEVYRFRSDVVHVEVDGSYSKSEINVGKAMTDSIESRNVAVRAELSLRYHAGTVLSEAFGMEGDRDVVAVSRTDHADAALASLVDALTADAGRGFAIAHPDLTAAGVEQVVGTNVQVEIAKRRALLQKEGPKALPLSPGKESLPELTTDADQQVEAVPDFLTRRGEAKKPADPQGASEPHDDPSRQSAVASGQDEPGTIAARLARLTMLRDQGVLTEEEYRSQREKIVREL